ncbi:MAG: CRISPR-associated endonuclease Cas3'' [Puniceicoccales bacterium]|nr:CRISPR-associated endonuclease Cas3'' [Puniceicoccales bacterium]
MADTLHFSWRGEGDTGAVAIKRVLALAAEYHDLGKLDDENQRVLASPDNAGHLPIPHSDAGVAHLLACSEMLAALFVFSHHTRLPDYVEIDMHGLRIRRKEIQGHIDSNLQKYLARHRSVFGDDRKRALAIEEKPVLPELKPPDVRLLFSCLTDADHGDAARFSGDEPERAAPPPLRAKERLEKLERYVAVLSDGVSERNKFRSRFFDACAAPPDAPAAAISYCDAPVGTGKTTAVMARLLAIAAAHGLRRVFVILPFTNIITQSAKIYRTALALPGECPETIVAEIHHRADFEDAASRRLTALWDAPIVVTTAVAFFETLAAASPAALRRLKNLPGSAIFLDEAHAMLPAKLLPLAWQWLRHAADKWSCRWILASGSLCHFWKLDEFGNDGRQIGNIVSDEMRQKLAAFEISRITYRHCPEAMEIVKFTKWLHTLDGPIVVVLNTVHTAAAVAREAEKIFGQGNVLHLSTALTPDDRDKTIAAVRERLENAGGDGVKWCLIATSCVEAGVDFSFRTGVRECASLMSLLQLAGRVNRNAEYANSDVWTISLDANDDGVTINPAYSVSSRILADYFGNSTPVSPALCTDALTREVRESANISTALLTSEDNYSFTTIEKDFHVIDDDSVVAIVDEDLIKRLEKDGKISWRDIQKFSVRVRRPIIQRLAIRESPRHPGLYIWNTKYSPFLGYMEAVLEMDGIDKLGAAIL